MNEERARECAEAICRGWGIDPRSAKAMLPLIAKTLNEATAELRDENRRLREFVEYVMRDIWNNCDPDGGSIKEVLWRPSNQEKAEELGLIEQRPAPEEYRREYESDTWYQCVWTPQEAHDENE